MGCTCNHAGTCGLCAFRRRIKTAPDYCSCGHCPLCDDLADQTYRLQHPERYCTGCGAEENHSHATSCATCHARYQRMISNYIGQEVTLWSQDTRLMVYGTLYPHLPQNYVSLPEYLRPLCVDKHGYAYVQFKPDQIVNVHTYNTTTVNGIRTAVQITIKL